MGCDVSSWLRSLAPVATAVPSSSSPKRGPLLFAFWKPTISCYTSGSTDSSQSSSLSTPSYSRRWYNPFGRRPLDQDPDIVRHWVEVDQPLASPERFTVASYNILGDRNASKHRDLYLNIPSFFLKWERRKKVICKELRGWSPDIICLQEVDNYDDLSDILVKAGYAGSYKRRTGDAVDGCAMFWKANEFRLLEAESIEFKGFGLRDNVAQLSAFEMCKGESRRILIGNIHVLYNPSRGDVKLGQIRSFLSRVQMLSAKWANAPVVLAGDFNSTPQSAIYKFLSSSQRRTIWPEKLSSCSSSECPESNEESISFDERICIDSVENFGQSNTAVLDLAHVTYVHDSALHEKHQLPIVRWFHVCYFFSLPFAYLSEDLNRLFGSCWTDEEVKVATGNAGCHLLVHPLKLASSYATVKSSSETRGFNGEPLATSYHSKFLGTVDYLWYSDGLVPTRVVDTIPLDILCSTGGLPCKKVGSDHLALVSEFSFPLRTEKGENTTTATDIAVPASREENDLLVTDLC